MYATTMAFKRGREEIRSMMEEADASLDEKVSFPEFERIMRWEEL